MKTDEDFSANEIAKNDSIVVDCKSKIAFCSSALNLLSAVQEALPRIQAMLRSETLGDVVEAIRFLSKAVRFNIAGASAAFTR